MRGSTLVFHGDEQDLRAVFTDWFGDETLVVVENIGRLNAEIRRFRGVDGVLGLLLRPGDLSAPAMAIAPVDRPLALRTVVMADGSGEKQALDFSNRFVVGIRFGGRTGPTELQPSVLMTSGDDDEARALFRRLKRVVLRRATRIRDCWVLPGAFEKLGRGWHLPAGQFHAAETRLPGPEPAD